MSGMTATPFYYLEYPGALSLKWGDADPELRRWF
jgi:hypothetical protein